MARMPTVAEVQEKIRELPPARPRNIHRPLHDAWGERLATTIHATTDSPPFAKALMDGYALNSQEEWSAGLWYPVAFEVRAGQLDTPKLPSGHVARIFTGAPLPPGSDAVIKQELARIRSEPWQVQFELGDVSPGLNVMARGEEFRLGDVLVPAGTRLHPRHLGLLASRGLAEVSIVAPLRVSIVSTGDELVAPGTPLQPGQIYDSNSAFLQGFLEQEGCQVERWGPVGDDPARLREVVQSALAQADLLLLSGGVSVGDYDQTPRVLAELGAHLEIHKIQMKPGKPLLFGTVNHRTAEGSQPIPVFGLPGNPVSVLACSVLFVRAALRALRGLPAAAPPPRARLAVDFRTKNDRPTFYPARLRWKEGRLVAWPNPRLSSANFRDVIQTQGLLEIPAGSWEANAGTELPVWLYDSLPNHEESE